MLIFWKGVKMPIFQYYNPYRKPYFYNNYRTNNVRNPIYQQDSNINSNFSPNQTYMHFTNSVPIYNSVNHQKNNISNSNENSFKEENRSKPKTDENVWLDLFGIKLYFDDVLILSLLFFLYKEEVKDEGLFLALVLLLIS